MREKKPLNKLIEEAIDEGATTVEDIHKSIAALPLKIFEQSDVLRGPVKEVKRVQDRTIGAIYDLIRDVNQKVGTLASDLLAKAASRKSGPGVGAKRHSARVAAH